jgi:NADH-quinone oxidoreductase subunit J
MKQLILTLLLAFCATQAYTVVAEAQPAPAAAPSVSKMAPHYDLYEATPTPRQPGLALLFWAFAATTIGGALFVITRRNLIAAVMGMVGSFMGIAAVYMMLYANFLSVVQMLVYAGAIMVLFVFVIMILNRPEDEPVAPSGRAGQALGGLAILYIVYRLVMLLIHVRPPEGAVKPPKDITLMATAPNVPGETVEWGSVKAVGANLFTDGLFPFEAISILLLVAVVGAIAIARPLHQDGEEGTP